jgi:C4-dicarboxylate-specific signal transduction histidine kinase
MEATETEIPSPEGADMTSGPDAATRKLARPMPHSQMGRQRDLEHLLAEGDEILALISSLSCAGLWSWDAATNLVWASKRARNILGLDDDAPLTRETVLGAVHSADRALLSQILSVNPRPSDTVEQELRVVRLSSDVRWVTTKTYAYRGADGAVTRVAGYVVDHYERKRAEAESIKQQQQITHLTRVAMLGELSGALAHELQQPLTAILCNAQAAQLLTAKAQFNAEELREILGDIVSDDKHAGQIIQHLRSLLIRGETQLHRLEIGDLVRDVLTLVRSTLSERKVRIEIRIAAGIPAVRGDRVELQQVLLNLILNACESMSEMSPADRRVEIVAALDPDQGVVRISVLDWGRGIAGDQLDRVFDAFFTTKEGGLGLGLAVCHSIIAAHKGRLWATNRAEHGAAFHFTLPVKAREAGP